MKLNAPLLTRRPFLVLPLALTVLFVLTAFIVYMVSRRTGGSFMYPLDDPFIHMIVAKMLAFQGTWGISPHEFESASSSVLYTLILAALFKVFSVNIFIPLIINIIAGALLVVVVQRWMAKQGVKPGAQLLTLLGVIILVPLPVLIISGMEHTLQCLFSFLFIFGFADWMAGPGSDGGGKVPLQTYLWGFLACAIRYEGLFLVAMVCLILLYKRRIGPAFLLGAVSFLPLLLFGVYSLSKGSYFLPNSVLMKSDGMQMSLSGVARFFGRILFKKLSLAGTMTNVAVHHLLLILPLTWLLLSRQMRQSMNYGYLLLIITTALFLQVCLAAVGWFYRYEAYLILSSLVLLSVLLYKYMAEIRQRLKEYPVSLWVVIFVLLIPFFLRSGEAFYTAPRACHNIYEQQYQMAQFLGKYYNNAVAVANDIGAVSYFKTEKNVDLYGLANIQVTRSKRNNYYTPQFLDSLCKGEHAQVAVIYDSWFSNELLSKWNKVASWSIPDNIICGDSVVSFYAIDKGGTPKLKRSLEAYQPALPAGVTVKYFTSGQE